MKIALLSLLVLFTLPSFASHSKCEIQGQGTIFSTKGIPSPAHNLSDIYVETEDNNWEDCMRSAQNTAEQFRPVAVINLDGGEPTKKTRNALMYLFMNWKFSSLEFGKKDAQGLLTVYTKRFEDSLNKGDRRVMRNGDYFTKPERD
jgi:hypothetical protein